VGINSRGQTFLRVTRRRSSSALNDYPSTWEARGHEMRVLLSVKGKACRHSRKMSYVDPIRITRTEPLGSPQSSGRIQADCNGFVPGNSSVNTVQHATIHEAVFSMSSALCPVLVTDQWTRSLTRDTFSVWSAPCNNRGAVFSVRGPCREDMGEYRNGNWLDLSSEVPREQQCGRRRIRTLNV
jgi:hypothetical protein